MSSREADFIAALRQLPLHEGARDLEDDCAVLQFGGETLVLTHDSMAEGTHFRADADLADVAWKLVTANLSDLASKGAEPIGLLLGYALGAHDSAFLDSLGEALRKFDTKLLGGDTIRANGPRTFGLTAIGRATHAPVPSRGGAREGDAVYVTGTLGRAMLGFEGDPAHRAAFDRPMPRIAEGKALAPDVTAMMDISDGLLLDAFRMAKASGKTLRIDEEAVPVASEDRRGDCLRWGDDYELLFTAPEELALPVAATRIGSVEAQGSAPLIVSGTAFDSPEGLGYTH